MGKKQSQTLRNHVLGLPTQTMNKKASNTRRIISNASGKSGYVLTYGHFSTIHPGHIRYLKHAKGLGEKLAVAVIGDKSKIRYPYTQKERVEALKLLGIADKIILMKGDDLGDAIKDIKPKILVLGNEYKQRDDLDKVLKSFIENGGSLQFHAGDIHYATSDLLGSSESALNKRRIQIFKAACDRQGLSKESLIKSMNNWVSTKLIVLGDTIVDQYAACEAIGMSAEAPVVVVRELQKQSFIGGAAIVAAHIRSLGAQCDLISVVGDDETAGLVKDQLKELNIGNSLVVDGTRPTTFKKRYVVENQKLFRVSRLEEQNIDKSTEDLMIKRLHELAPMTNGIVISDFVYGVVTPNILNEVQIVAKKHNLMLFGDLQCSSQVGAVTKFKEFALLCPNEREARLAMQDKDSGLEKLSKNLIESTQTNKLVMKLGSEGFIAYDQLSDGEYLSQAFPALSVNPVDVAGAGDSLLAVFATGLASGENMMLTAAIACCMAAQAVETMGNKPIGCKALQKFIDDVL